MSLHTDIKEAIDKQGEAFEEFKKVNDQRLEAVKKGNESLAKELEAKLDKINADVTKFNELKKTIEKELNFQRERIEELESRATSPKTAEQKAKDRHKELFNTCLRKQFSDGLELAELRALEKKDITIGTGSAGGFAVPEQIARDIELLEKKFSPVRDLVKVVQVGTSDYKELVNIRGATSGWIGETGSRTATATPSLREVTPTHGELYAYPQVSEWSLDDIFFNVENWLADNVAQEFAIQEADAVVRGNGTSKPTGMINSAPTNVADQFPPSRAAAVYQYTASGSAATLGTSPDPFLTMAYTVNSAYRSNGTWVMNSLTTATVRKFKDSTNQYLWQPGLQAGQPDQILGRPVSTWEQMDDEGSNTFPVAFGDFRRGYLLVDRVGLRITRDNVTNIGFVRFYIRRREGGIVLNNDAIKFIKCATS